MLTAIEAQHGGFPSRLLDVSFNSLIALHFAVTPFYNEKEDVYDRQDGKVYVIEANNLYSPSSLEIEELYSNELLNNHSFKNEFPLFSYSYKMLDYHTKNSRIKAQQGGFIMFYGNEFRPLPKSVVNELTIPCLSKKRIRIELEKLFGISNAFVYPEMNNVANRFVNTLEKYSQTGLSDKGDLNNILESFYQNIDYCTKKIVYEYNKYKGHLNRLSVYKEENNIKGMTKYCKQNNILINFVDLKKDGSPKNKTKFYKIWEKEISRSLKNDTIIPEVIALERYLIEVTMDINLSKRYLVDENKNKPFDEKYFDAKVSKFFEMLLCNQYEILSLVLGNIDIELMDWTNIFKEYGDV
ncbi:hypothetical protein RU98_GL002581 [Enterococcus caccae]|nr:hypothetical protein RU98_GL002581 [Enterococcus caccae]